MDKEKLMNFIKECKASGKEPHKEAMKRFSDVVTRLEINTYPYRRAWSKPIGFYVLRTTQEAIDILIAETKKYKPVCPRGYTDCVNDPAYIKYYYPEWYRELYGDMTPEEASHKKGGCYDRVKEDPNEEYYCYDDEDK